MSQTEREHLLEWMTPPAVEPEDSLGNLQEALTGLSRAARVDSAGISARATIGDVVMRADGLEDMGPRENAGARAVPPLSATRPTSETTSKG
eukprot:1299441-Pyramimonas_sp.AAC.1